MTHHPRRWRSQDTEGLEELATLKRIVRADIEVFGAMRSLSQ
jgi:hypothetical protein